MKKWRVWKADWTEKEVRWGSDADAAQWRRDGFYVEEAQ